MKISRLSIFFSAIFISLLIYSGVRPLISQAAPNPSPQAVSIRGLTQVDHQPAVIEILVQVSPGVNPHAAAQVVLRRAYPDVRLFDSAEYSTTGLVWDQFFDQDPGNNFVTVNYNDKNYPSSLQGQERLPTLQLALDTWSAVPTSDFTFSFGDTAGRCPSLVRECRGPQKFDGQNDVGWLNISDPSVLGVTWYGTQTDEFDMVLDNNNFSWFIGNPSLIPPSAYDTQTVWLHEFGHGLGLGHSQFTDAVMYAYYQEPRRVLHSDDLDGITTLYPVQNLPTPTPTPEITPTPTPSGEPTPTPCWPPGKCKDKKK
jgi:hypothetical protein